MDDRILHQDDVEAITDELLVKVLDALPEDLDLTEAELRAIVQDEFASSGTLTESEIRAIILDEISKIPPPDDFIAEYSTPMHVLPGSYGNANIAPLVSGRTYWVHVSFDAVPKPPSSGNAVWGLWQNANITVNSAPPSPGGGTALGGNFWKVTSAGSDQPAVVNAVFQLTANANATLKISVDNSEHSQMLDLTGLVIKVYDHAP